MTALVDLNACGTTEIIDVSRPIELPTRLAAQVEKRYRERDQIDREINGIVDNYRRHMGEDDAAISKRLARFRYRQGLAQVRYLLTGHRHKGAADISLLRAFHYVDNRCRKAGQHGAQIRVEEVASYLGVTERQAFRILDQLENKTPHRILYLAQDETGAFIREWVTSPGVILRRNEAPKPSRYFVTLPESDEYLKELRDTIGRDAVDDALPLSDDESIPYAARLYRPSGMETAPAMSLDLAA